MESLESIYGFYEISLRFCVFYKYLYEMDCFGFLQSLAKTIRGENRHCERLKASWRALRSNSPTLANPFSLILWNRWNLFADSMESLCDSAFCLNICIKWIASSVLADFLAKTVRGRFCVVLKYFCNMDCFTAFAMTILVILCLYKDLRFL